MENEKLDQQFRKIVQDFWIEHHIRIDSLNVSINWVDVSPIGGENSFFIDSLVIKTN